MKVIKRTGKAEEFDISKLSKRISNLMDGIDTAHVDLNDFLYKAEAGMCDDITTIEIDEFCAELAASLISKHSDYGILASKILISKLHKETKNSFSEKIKYLDERINIISESMVELVNKYGDIIDKTIVYERDYSINYFGIKTLTKNYLMNVGVEIVERPQDLFMRTALGIHGSDLESAFETYHLISMRYFVHATPTLFNAGTKNSQLSSCFLLNIQDDSIDGIFNTVKQCAVISKGSGGLGVNIHKIRARGSIVKGTNGKSNGIIPMIKIFDATAKFVDQGGNKRPGALAVYLEPWHAEIFEFLDLRKNTGKDEIRARDIFLGLWIPDLFMERVKSNGDWALFCPSVAPGLEDVWGEEFNKLYIHYEQSGKAKTIIKAQKLWKAIIETQIETGNPYMVYKDSSNRKSNQKNIGTIKGSNLCTEILEYSSPDEIAVCNLASIGLPMFIENGVFNFQKLREITAVVTKNLNKVIDVINYSLEETKRSNLRHRPMGLGVQGLADVFMILRYPFESKEAKQLNKDIFETIYFSALETSCELARIHGYYESFIGSPASQGILQYDFWNVTPSDRWDWNGLKDKIKKYGLRNSLLLAPMPTASTSQILGFNECIEPITSNIYTRRTMAGDFQVVNSYLMKDLVKINLWNNEIKNLLVEHEGSVQNINIIPQNIKDLYKTVWEIKMKNIIDMAVDRGAFIDQSQSLNLFIAEPTYSRLTSMHFYAFQKGLKTGMYYLRTKPISSAIKFTVDKEMVKKSIEKMNGSHCEMQEDCLSCGS